MSSFMQMCHQLSSCENFVTMSLDRKTMTFYMTILGSIVQPVWPQWPDGAFQPSAFVSSGLQLLIYFHDLYEVRIFIGSVCRTLPAVGMTVNCPNRVNAALLFINLGWDDKSPVWKGYFVYICFCILLYRNDFFLVSYCFVQYPCWLSGLICWLSSIFLNTYLTQGASFSISSVLLVNLTQFIICCCCCSPFPYSCILKLVKTEQCCNVQNRFYGRKSSNLNQTLMCRGWQRQQSVNHTPIVEPWSTILWVSTGDTIISCRSWQNQSAQRPAQVVSEWQMRWSIWNTLSILLLLL